MSPAGGCTGPVDGVGVLCMHDAAPAGLEGFRSGRGGLLPGTAHLPGVTMSASALLSHCALGVRHEGTCLDVGPFLGQIRSKKVSEMICLPISRTCNGCLHRWQSLLMWCRPYYKWWSSALCSQKSREFRPWLRRRPPLQLWRVSEELSEKSSSVPPSVSTPSSSTVAKLHSERPVVGDLLQDNLQ